MAESHSAIEPLTQAGCESSRKSKVFASENPSGFRRKRESRGNTRGMFNKENEGDPLFVGRGVLNKAADGTVDEILSGEALR
jgi:hypothetical protein